jgi:hypothetical protein
VEGNVQFQLELVQVEQVLELVSEQEEALVLEEAQVLEEVLVLQTRSGRMAVK